MKNIVFLVELLIILSNFCIQCEITYIEVKYPLNVSYIEYVQRFVLSVSHLRDETNRR
jgi:hypothetical protein